MMTVMLSLYSCIHDEVYSSSDPSSTEYTNKSLWKQDEKYITNVMKVYAENEADIKKVNGIPYWNFATTVESFDESFVAVPIIDNGKVTSVLKVPRHGKKIYFYYTQDESDLSFFQALIFAKIKKAGMPDGSTAQTNTITCTRQWVSMWYPDDESNPDGPGSWGSPVSIIKCKALKDECLGFINEYGQCDGGNGEDGYTYPGGGGGGGTEPVEEEEDPCDKIKAQREEDPDFESNITNLKGKTGLKTETGYIQRTNGQYAYQNNASATLDANELSLPSLALLANKDIKGYMHTHVNDFTYDNPDGPGTITRKGFKIFSPADVNYFMELVKNALENGIPLEDVYAVLVSSGQSYQIRFTGTQDQIKIFTDSQMKILKNDFIRFMDEYKDNSKKLEIGFFKFLDEKMNLKGIGLYRMNANGITTELQPNANQTSINENNCPQ